MNETIAMNVERIAELITARCWAWDHFPLRVELPSDAPKDVRLLENAYVISVHEPSDFLTCYLVRVALVILIYQEPVGVSVSLCKPCRGRGGSDSRSIGSFNITHEGTSAANDMLSALEKFLIKNVNAWEAAMAE